MSDDRRDETTAERVERMLEERNRILMGTESALRAAFERAGTAESALGRLSAGVNTTLDLLRNAEARTRDQMSAVAADIEVSRRSVSEWRGLVEEQLRHVTGPAVGSSEWFAELASQAKDLGPASTHTPGPSCARCGHRLSLEGGQVVPCANRCE